MKVVLADAVAAECAEVLAAEGIETVVTHGRPVAALHAALADADGLVVRSSTQVDAALMDRAPQLKVVGRAGAGVDNVDVATATQRGILVMNAPGANTLAAAEHAFAMLMAVCRNIPAAHASMAGGSWAKKDYMGVELYGKTLGVIGMGRIGSTVAQRARAFGMRVLGFDPFLPPEAAEKLGVELAELDAILPQADFLTLHSPLNERTRHLLARESLARCKPGVRIVNCARGGLIDEAALVEALDSGHVAGAALDVFEAEPLPSEHPLRGHPRLVLTPHLGASTAEAQVQVAARIAEQIAGYLLRGAVVNAVNMTSVDAELAERLAPYQRLAEAMGLLHGRLIGGRFEELQVEAAGSILELPLRALTASALKGFLGEQLNQTVNVVNAPSVAQERGYRFSEVRGQDADGYAGLLTVRVRSEAGEHLLQGTVFGQRFFKLVRIDEYFIETAPKGDMLFASNDDVPGRLAGMAGVLARHGVNVANMALGRHREAGRALAAFNLDASLPADALAELRAIDGVTWAQSVEFAR
ncbi:MAG TPA: phosphoglycerate dehydrogenase [Planctomycetota bacterium]